MKQHRSSIYILASVLGFGGGAGAVDLFTYQITVNGATTVNNGVNDITKLVDLFGDSSLANLFPGYTPNSTVSAAINLRGLHGTLSYSAASSDLVLSIPSANISVTFPGADRNASRDLLRRWLKGLVNIKNFAESAQLETLLQSVVKYSPVDPAAGNPNSLQSRMFMADYNLATTGPRVQLTGLPADESAPENLFRVDLNYSGARQGGAYTVNTVELDFGGVINFGNRHWAMLLDWPMMASFSETAPSVMLYPGVGVQYRVNDWWSMTAFGRGGLVGSVQVGALAAMYSATLTSYMTHDFGNTRLGWGLMGGFNNTINGITIDNYNVTYGIANYPVTTGLDVSAPFSFKVFGQPTAWTVYGNYTHLFGSDLYLQDIGEVGIGFRLTRASRGMEYDRTRLLLGYQFGQGYDGVTARLTFNF